MTAINFRLKLGDGSSQIANIAAKPEASLSLADLSQLENQKLLTRSQEQVLAKQLELYKYRYQYTIATVDSNAKIIFESLKQAIDGELPLSEVVNQSRDYIKEKKLSFARLSRNLSIIEELIDKNEEIKFSLLSSRGSSQNSTEDKIELLRELNQNRKIIALLILGCNPKRRIFEVCEKKTQDLSSRIASYKEQRDNLTSQDKIDYRNLLFKAGYSAPQLTEKVRLIAEYKAKYNEARDLLAIKNSRLVINIAKNYQKTGGLEFSDLVAEGHIALMRAIDGFDWRRGNKFSTYATNCIKHAIAKSIIDNMGVVKTPIYSKDKFYLISNTEEELTKTFGRKPTISEVAETILDQIVNINDLKKIVKDYKALHRMTASPNKEDLHQLKLLFALKVIAQVKAVHGIGRSLNRPIKGEDRTFADLLPDLNNTSSNLNGSKEKKKFLIKAFEKLRPREQEVLAYRFGLEDDKPLTLDKIGKIMGVTRERVRQIETIAKKKLEKAALENFANEK